MTTDELWAGRFGTEYSKRCFDDEHSIAKIAVFADVLRAAPGANSAIELGCNVGGNLKALETLRPDMSLAGVEINAWAADQAMATTGAEIITASMFDIDFDIDLRPRDLAFTAGVLIHTPPNMLQQAYERLVELSCRYVLVMEYYSPRPVMIPYRGMTDKLWKRDFAGEMMDSYPLRLVDYRFVYYRDVFPQDDMTWFLMEKI